VVISNVLGLILNKTHLLTKTHTQKIFRVCKMSQKKKPLETFFTKKKGENKLHFISRKAHFFSLSLCVVENKKEHTNERNAAHAW
jgi:hypothetical protein